MKKILFLILASFCVVMCSSADGGTTSAPTYSVSVFRNGLFNDAWVTKALVSDYSNHSEIWDDWDNSKALRDTMSIALFEHEFDSVVTVRVHTDRKFRSCAVRPSSYGIEPVILDHHTVEFTLPSYQMRKVSVEFDGNRQENLFVVGNRPDAAKPSSEDSGVMYFGPGEHEVGELTLEDNQTVYVDFGAVLYANFVVSGNNVRIAGNGIISGKKMKHWGNTQYACGDVLFEVGPSGREFLENFTVEDVTFIDSPSWTFMLNRINGVRIENINMINWILNGDGIDLVCCQNALVKDCLLRCYDDCITLKVNHGNRPDCCNIEIDGCLIWEDIARGIVVGPEAGNVYMSPGRIHSVDIHDCVFLEHRGTSEGDNVRAALSICQWKHPVERDGYATEISDIFCRNLYFDDISADGTYIYVWQMPMQTECSYMRNIVFEDIVVNDANRVKNPIFQAVTNENHILGLTISNFTVNGRKVLSAGRDFICTGNISDLSFK
jgi:hypothetical protein